MPNTWGLSSDVDGTWTCKADGALVKIVDDRALPPEAKVRMQALRDRYTPLAHAKLITPAQEMDWLLQTLDVFVEYRLTRRAWQAALRGVRVRQGVAETFAWCRAVGLKTCAVSYGCADFVEFVAEQNGVRIDAVYAGRLVYDARDTVIGYEEGSLLIPEQKGERSREFADRHGIAHHKLIGVGDTAGDRHIGHLQEHRLGIAETDEERAQLHGLGIMGEIHVTMSFEPILSAIKRRTGAT